MCATAGARKSKTSTMLSTRLCRSGIPGSSRLLTCSKERYALAEQVQEGRPASVAMFLFSAVLRMLLQGPASPLERIHSDFFDCRGGAEAVILRVVLHSGNTPALSKTWL